MKISEEEAIKLLEEQVITGHEGFFCLKSSKNLTLKEALVTYRKKDSIEKIFYSLKNEIEIKPLRVWSDASIYGVILVGFIAQLFISLMRYEFDELKHKSTKFIKKSLLNLTVKWVFLTISGNFRANEYTFSSKKSGNCQTWDNMSLFNERK